MEYNLEKYIELLEKKIMEIFHGENTGHDLNHLKRVYNIALTIQEKEGGDRFVIGVSALLHDIHRIIEKDTGKFCPPKDSLLMISKILEEIDFPKEKEENILHCIEFHDEYGFTKDGKSVTDVETLILQDADNLDAIGAIGVGRTFSFGGAHNVPMWVPEIQFAKNFEGEHKLDPSTLHHIYSKLFELKNNMNTNTAKNMAIERHKFMELFFEHFKNEWNGNI